MVTIMLRYPLVSDVLFNDCANDSDFRKMRTESRTSTMGDGPLSMTNSDKTGPTTNRYGKINSRLTRLKGAFTHQSLC